MRLWFSWLLLAVVSLGCGSAPPRAFMMRDVQFPLRDLKFPSGLRVVVEEDHRVPLVGVVMLVGVGSTSDPPGKEGLAHYVEHLTFRSRPDGKSSIDALLGRAGSASWQAHTGWDETVFEEIGPKEALGGLVTLEGLRLSAPITAISDEAAGVEREVVQNELRQRQETGYAGGVFAELQATLFPPGHPYERAVVGTRATIPGLTLDDARGFAAQHYKPENVTMVVIGDVDLATVSQKIQESLPRALLVGSHGPAVPRLDATPPEPPAPPPTHGIARITANVATPELWIGWTLPRSVEQSAVINRFEQQNANAALANAYFHDEDISAIHVGLVGGKRASILYCRVTLFSGANPERSMEHVLNQIAATWSGGGPPSFRGGALAATVLAAQSLIVRGEERAELTHLTGDPAAYSRSLAALMKIESVQVQDYATRYLTRERARGVFVAPTAGTTTPPDEGEAASAWQDSDEALGLDAAAIRAFIRPVGATAFRRVVLENGVEIVIARRAGLPVATVGVSVHGGAAAALPRGADGIVRALGTRRVNSHRMPYEFGGQMHAHYGLDQTLYTLEGSSGNVANMIDMLATWVPSFRVDSVQAYRANRLPIVQKFEANPETGGRRAFLKALFGEHAYGHETTSEDLGRVSASEADDWVERTMVGHNAVVAIAGEVDVAEVERLAREAFGGWSSAPAPRPLPAPAAAATPVVLVTHRGGASQAELTFGCRLTATSGVAPPEVLARLLRGRLFRTLRRDAGATYGVSVSAHALRGAGTYLEVRSAIANAQLAKGVEVLRHEIAALAHGDLTPEELDDARWRAASGYSMGSMTTGQLAGWIVGARNLDRDLLSLDRYPEEVIAVTKADVQAAASTCITSPVMSLVGDEPTIRAALQPH